MAGKPRWTRRKLLFLGALALCAVVLGLRTRYAADAACTALRRQLPGMLGLEVGVNGCELEPLTQSVTLRGVSAFAEGAQEPLFAVDEAVVKLRSFRAPFAVELEQVSLVRLRVNLDWSRPGSGPGGSPPECPLEVLRRAKVSSLEVKGAEIRATLPGGRQLELAGLDVGWTVRRGVAEFQADARRGVVSTGDGRELLLSRLVLEGGLDVGEEILELTRGEVVLDQASLSLAGRVDGLCDPTLALGGQVFVPLSSVATALGTQEKVAGHLWSRVSLTGRAELPIAQIDLVGSDLGWGDFAPGDFTARVLWAGKELTLAEFAAPAGSGTVRASGSLRLVPTLPIRLKVETENAQFGSILAKASVPGSWVDFPATTQGSFSGSLSPVVNLSGEAEIRSGRFLLTNHAFDSRRRGRAEVPEDDVLLSFGPARTTLKVGVHPDRVELGAVRIEVAPGNTRVDGDITLFFDPARGLSIRARGDAIDLGDFGHISGLPWSGKGSATAVLEGPYENIAIESKVALRDFTFWDFGLGVAEGRVIYRDRVLGFPAFTGQKGKTQYFGQGELKWSPSGELSVRGDVQVPRGHSSDLVDVVAGLSPSLEMLQGTLGGAASGTLHFEGPASHFGGTVDLDLKDTTYYGRRVGEGKLLLRFVDGAAMVLEKTVLTGPLGTASVDGSWAFSGPLDFRYSLEGAPLTELVGPERARSLGISGAVRLVGKVEGDTTTPVASAYLTSARVVFAGKELGATHLEGRILGRDLQIWGRPFDEARALVKVKLREPWAFDGSLTVALPEIRPLLPEGAVSQGLSGALAGTLSAVGTLADLPAVKAQGRIDKLSLSRGDFTGANDGPIALSYERGRWGIDSFAFKGPNTELTAAGWYGPEELDLSMRGAFDMRLLESFLPALERTAGRVEVHAAATGSVRHPDLVGTAEIGDVRLSLRDQAFSVRALSGRMEFSEARVLVQDVLGILNDGRVSLRGDVRLSDFAVKRLELSVGLEEVSLRPFDYLPFTASGELLLAGTLEALQLSGGLDIVKLRYDRPIELGALLKEVRQGRLGGSGEKPREWLRFDVDLAASGDVRVDNNLAKAKLAGKLKLIGTNVRPGLLGTIEAAEGSQAFYRGNQFAVSKGEMQFKDRDGMDPLVDLYAQTQVREYLVTLKAFGRLSDPKVVLGSEPALSEGDVLSLLTLGVTSRDRGLPEAGAGLAAEALFSAVGLDRQVQRFLPKNALLRDMSFHLSTTYNEASGLIEPTAQLESNFLTDRLRLGMTQPVSGRGTRAQAEYQFNDRLSARAQWDNENQEYSFGNPGLDLKLRWEVE